MYSLSKPGKNGIYIFNVFFLGQNQQLWDANTLQTKKTHGCGKTLCLIVMKNTPVLPSLLVDTLTGIHYEIG